LAIADKRLLDRRFKMKTIKGQARYRSNEELHLQVEWKEPINRDYGLSLSVFPDYVGEYAETLSSLAGSERMYFPVKITKVGDRIGITHEGDTLYEFPEEGEERELIERLFSEELPEENVIYEDDNIKIIKKN
jgi:hypothetical protein